MKSTTATRILLTLAAIGLLEWGLWKTGSAGRSAPAPSGSGSASPSRQATAPAASPIAAALDRLQVKSDRSGTLQTLKELRTALQTMPRDEARDWILAFLDTGQDQATGLDFEITSGGALAGWPTLRTFLIDTLLAVDPQAAAELGRQVLTTPTSADEWALALRNVGRVETSVEANDYLRERTESLIANPAWQNHPSIGYLNAFDVLVHAHATASTPLLSRLIQQKDRKDLAHAGFLTLDRLVQRDPLEVLPQLAADPSLHASRPEMIAQQFARADLRDPAQREIVKSWLLDPARTATELRSFAAVYPNNNRFISNNLLTTETPLSGASLGEHDREVLGIIRSWAEDPAFQPLAGHLGTMTARLNGFVGSTQTSSVPAR